jgi:hypothetical protein
MAAAGHEKQRHAVDASRIRDRQRPSYARFGLFSANSASPFGAVCLTGLEMINAAWQGASGTYAGHGHGLFITVIPADSTGTLMTFTAKSR